MWEELVTILYTPKQYIIKYLRVVVTLSRLLFTLQDMADLDVFKQVA